MPTCIGRPWASADYRRLVTESGITLRELASRPVSDLNGVGPVRQKALASVGVDSVLDLLTYYPRRYIDRSREASVADLVPGAEGVVLVRIGRVSARRTKNRRSLVEARVTGIDGTGHLTLTFFNQPWREKQLKLGKEVVVFGRAEDYRGSLQMTNPVVDLMRDQTGRIFAVYPQNETAGLHSRDVDDMVAEALRRTLKVRGLSDPVPAEIRRRYRFIDRSQAYRAIHRPENMRDIAEARRRLVFDELFRIQVALVRRKVELERNATGIIHSLATSVQTPGDNPDALAAFLDSLEYKLTVAQRRVIEEIRDDMSRPSPMHRLLQGDVGSGKTVVAVAALLTAVGSGHQGALMAPTEVLAEQHYEGIAQMLIDVSVNDPATLLGCRPLKMGLLTNRTPAAERRRIVAELIAGGVDLLVGTHALIQDGVQFRSLGAVVIDEQHRFGVEQRAALRSQNEDGTVPDVLVMTATPIPRTAAMTVYGDLDVSVLDELPPGRTPIETRWCVDEDEAWPLVRAEVADGRQAYVVCPLIDQSDTLDVRSAEQTFTELSSGALSGLRVGLLHGRVGRAEKDETMRLFRAGSLDVLVATTVVEVGVDVPNATVMVILNAARFGIAQLHQLRGRVGRSTYASRCLLAGEAPTPDADERLRALVRTADGFELAEVDLDLRGEGTIMGERQKGRNDLRLASLRRDRDWVEAARKEAVTLVGDGSGLKDCPEFAGEVDLFLAEDESDYLFKS